MKKYKVKRAFFDKETGAPYSVGDTYQTEDEARAKTLRAGGYIAGGIVSKSDTGKGKGADKPDGGGEKPEETKTPEAGGEKPEETKTPEAGGEKPDGKGGK